MEIVLAKGHSNITARHKNAIEVTKAASLGIRGDCIIGVAADRGLSQFSEEFKRGARALGSKIRVVLRAGDIEEVVLGEGHPDLSLEDGEDIVIRRSDFLCTRTLMIKADKGSRDLDRRLIDALKDGRASLTMEISLANGMKGASLTSPERFYLTMDHKG